MSMIQTDPIVNPTTEVVLPNQVLESQEIDQNVDLSFHNQEMIKPSLPIPINQMTFTTYPMKNKPIIDPFIWTTIMNPGLVKVIKVNWTLLKQLIPAGLNINSFLNGGTAILNIKNTNNAFFQGLVKVIWEPTPLDLFKSEFTGSPTTLGDYWQMNGSIITPDTKMETNLLLPFNFPWRMLPISGTPVLYDVDLAEYFEDYVFGFIRFVVYSKLRSNNALTQLVYSLNLQLMDTELKGTKII